MNVSQHGWCRRVWAYRAHLGPTRALRLTLAYNLRLPTRASASLAAIWLHSRPPHARVAWSLASGREIYDALSCVHRARPLGPRWCPPPPPPPPPHCPPPSTPPPPPAHTHTHTHTRAVWVWNTADIYPHPHPPLPSGADMRAQVPSVNHGDAEGTVSNGLCFYFLSTGK